MARNRKSQSPGLLFGPALKAALICGFILVCCVGYVWQKKQIAELSHQIKGQENHLAALRYDNDKLKQLLAVLLSTEKLEARAKDLKLSLPQPSQIWRLPAPPVETPAVPKAEQRYAAERSGGPALP
jgi:hypothetical protein